MKALDFLVSRGCIRKDVGFEGTIVTVLKYHVYQDKRTYVAPDPDPVGITPHGPPDPVGITPLIPGGSPSCLASGSRGDHPISTSKADLLLPVFADYLDSLPPKKRKKEQKSLENLFEAYPGQADQIAACLRWTRAHPVPSKNGEIRECDHPAAYLEHKMDEVVRKLGLTKRVETDRDQGELEPSVMTLADMEAELERIERDVPSYAPSFRKLVEARRATAAR
jgi:hypothetical protein